MKRKKIGQRRKKSKTISIVQRKGVINLEIFEKYNNTK